MGHFRALAASCKAAQSKYWAAGEGWCLREETSIRPPLMAGRYPRRHKNAFSNLVETMAVPQCCNALSLSPFIVLRRQPTHTHTHIHRHARTHITYMNTSMHTPPAGRFTSSNKLCWVCISISITQCSRQGNNPLRAEFPVCISVVEGHRSVVSFWGSESCCWGIFLVLIFLFIEIVVYLLT